ncbi:MAG: GntR family transcriptional regulator [Piscinibacter sp.]|nr:GntR family transcriptional regulator [Piscinibacter sp.]
MAASTADLDSPARPGPRLAERALYEQVAERLRQRILAHALAPGSWIDEQALAAEYGISRTPLREALKVLAAEGLVTMKLRRGAYVTEVSERDLSEVFHLLALLESDAASVAAERATVDELRELRAIHAELEANVHDRDRFFAANERFHLRLLEIADNRWRIQLVADLRKVMKLNRRQSLLRQGRIEASLLEHRRLLAALEKRDAGRAQALMRAHLDAGREAATLS